MELRDARAWSGSVRICGPGAQETNKRRGVSAMPVTPPAGAQQRFAPLTTVEQIPLPEYSVAATHHPGGRLPAGCAGFRKAVQAAAGPIPAAAHTAMWHRARPSGATGPGHKSEEGALLPQLQGPGQGNEGG